MQSTIKTLRVVQWAMLASIVLYAVIGEAMGPKVASLKA